MIIYKTTNLINGRFYIGQDTHNDPKYLGSGLLLKQAIEKYGIDSFKKDILEKCSSKEELNEKEIFWIKELKAQERGKGYNITKGGSGGDVFSNNPNKEEIRENYRKGAFISNNRPEIKEKIKNTMIDKWKEEEYRNKVLENQQKVMKTDKYRLEQSIRSKKVIHTPDWNKKVGKNNVIRFHIKKIKYFLENDIDINIISGYFNISIDKINEALKMDGFDKEPNVDVLLEAYKMYKEGLKINTIHRKMANAPAKLQMKIFFEIKG
jgi:acyl-CoA-binding protein